MLAERAHGGEAQRLRGGHQREPQRPQRARPGVPRQHLERQADGIERVECHEQREVPAPALEPAARAHAPGVLRREPELPQPLGREQHEAGGEREDDHRRVRAGGRRTR